MGRVILCLANSRKHLERCVAGREWANGGYQGWVRPISARDGHGVSFAERQLPDLSEPKVGDFIDLGLLGHQPTDCHVENWLLDPQSQWTKLGAANWAHMLTLAETPQTLWANSYPDTYHGINDQMSQALAYAQTSSLALIHATDLVLKVFQPQANFGNPAKKVQAKFSHNGTNYWLMVSDPVYEVPYAAQPMGEYPIGECLLTVSLTELYAKTNTVLKVVAAIIQPQNFP